MSCGGLLCCTHFGSLKFYQTFLLKGLDFYLQDFYYVDEAEKLVTVARVIYARRDYGKQLD